MGFLTHTPEYAVCEGENFNILLFEKETGNLHGMSKSASKNFKIPKSLIEGNSSKNHDFRISEILEGVLEEENFTSAMGLGFYTMLDTRCIKENYMLDQEEDSENYETLSNLSENESMGNDNISMIHAVEEIDVPISRKLTVRQMYQDRFLSESTKLTRKRAVSTASSLRSRMRLSRSYQRTTKTSTMIR